MSYEPIPATLEPPRDVDDGGREVVIVYHGKAIHVWVSPDVPEDAEYDTAMAFLDEQGMLEATV